MIKFTTTYIQIIIMKVGIDQISYYIPKIALSIEEFAKAKNIKIDKLKLGLGLEKISLMDVHEDIATMCANALYSLFQTSNIDLKNIGRIYLGTESSLDGSKPTATYAVDLVEKQLEKKFGKDFLRNIDVLDATFACIGAVDLLQNSLDYIRVNPNKKAIVIAGDYAKYPLNSSGEYTQGAGVVAMILSKNPSIIAFKNLFGVSTKSEHDFFKPRRYYSTSKILGIKTPREEIEIFNDEPIFDGKFSNQCYQDRIREAYFHLKNQKSHNGSLFDSWSKIIFHLPYAFHGRKIFTEIYALEKGCQLEKINKEVLKKFSQSQDYKKLLKEKIISSEKASSEVGNLYTASIFMAMLSSLKVSELENEELSGKTIGFIAYGSGSKSKVIEGVVQQNWKKKIAKINLFKNLNSRVLVDFKIYEKLHNKQLKQSIIQPKNEFVFSFMEKENQNQIGARYYHYQS